MKYESTSDKPNSSNKKLLSWDELLEKGALLKDTILRLSLTPDRPYLSPNPALTEPSRRVI